MGSIPPTPVFPQEPEKLNGKYGHRIPEKPMERFLPLLKGYRQYSRGYLARCPAHADRHPSLMIWEDETDTHVGLKCHAGCTRKQICETLGISESSLYADDGLSKQGASHPVLTTIDLVIDKLIHPHFLESLGVKDDKRGVIIPYYNQDGSPYERYRVRTRLSAKKGSTWNTDSQAPLIPYGLDRLAKAREIGYLVIVEGESDCWTLWQHGIPALGVPGVGHSQVLTPEMLTDIPSVYIVQEDDTGGEKFTTNVEKHLKKSGYQGKLYTIEMRQAGVNDPNDLQKRDLKGFKAAFETLLARAFPLFSIGKKPRVSRMRDLQIESLPETRWAIPDLVPEGLTLLCGKPKLGKSWLLLSLLLAVACGGVALGNVAVEQGEVLYISLEDNKKRLQKRANIVNQNHLVSENFYYATEWPRLSEGGLEYLEEWIVSHPHVRLIGIDTWAKIKPRSRYGTSRQYEEDYDAFTPLQELAAKYGVSILVVHHMRKTESDDPLDMILGSIANAGAVDGMLTLSRKRGETDARLFVTGRDIEEEQELLLSFHQECATWKIKGDAHSSEMATTPERQRLIDALKPQPMTVKELALKLGKNVNTTRNHLLILRNEGRVTLENNVYRLVTTSNTSKASNTSNTSNLPDEKREVTRPDDLLTSPTSLVPTSLVTPDTLADTHGEPFHTGHVPQVTSVTSLTSQTITSHTSNPSDEEPEGTHTSDEIARGEVDSSDYGDEETIVSPDTSGDEPVEPFCNGHSPDLTRLPIPDYGSEEKSATCPYRLTIAEDAHPLNIEKYQHHRRVITAYGDGWVTHIGKDTLRVWLDGMFSTTEWKFYQALPVKETTKESDRVSSDKPKNEPSVPAEVPTPETCTNYPYDVIAWHRANGLTIPRMKCLRSHSLVMPLPWYNASTHSWENLCDQCYPALRSTNGRDCYFD